MDRVQMIDFVNESLDIKLVSERLLPLAIEKKEEWKRNASKWSVTLTLNGGTYNERVIATTYWMGSAHKEPPTTADVLASLCLDARCGESTYADYISDFGAEDSAEQKALHKRCVLMTKRLKHFLGEHYETACNAEH
jgi:hypothetical protein